MFGIGAVEFILLLVLAVIMFGPEKLPEFSRKAARVIIYIRNIANNAQTQLRDELGPEFSDLKIEDLNPKAFVAKHMREEMALLEEAREDLAKAQEQITSAANLARREARDAERSAKAKTITATGSTAASISTATTPKPTAMAKAITAGSELIFDEEAT